MFYDMGKLFRVFIITVFAGMLLVAPYIVLMLLGVCTDLAFIVTIVFDIVFFFVYVDHYHY